VISGTLMLFNWSLKMDSKSIYPHVIRAAFSFLMFFFISVAFADAFGTSRTGLRYFESICFLNVLLITVCGVSYFVTAVTEEKDAGSFALLRLAGMTALSITLGKSTSRLGQFADAVGDSNAIYVSCHHSGRGSVAADHCVLYCTCGVDGSGGQSGAVLQRALYNVRPSGRDGGICAGDIVFSAEHNQRSSGSTACWIAVSDSIRFNFQHTRDHYTIQYSQSSS